MNKHYYCESCSSNESTITPDEYFNAIEESTSAFEVHQMLESFVPRRVYKYSVIPNDDIKAKERFQQLIDGQIWLSKTKYLNDPFELEHMSLKNSSQEARDYYYKKKPEIEILSLAQSPFNKLMWSHYANSYKGFCIEFGVSNKCSIEPVFYENRLRDLSNAYQSFYENRQNLFSSGSKGDTIYKDLLRIQYPLLAKDACWSYEHEFRIIRSSDDLSGKGHLYQLEDLGLYIKKIIVGSQCEQTHVDEFIKSIELINGSRLAKRKDNLSKAQYLKKGSFHDDIELVAEKLMKKYNENVEITRLKLNDDLSLCEEPIQEENDHG